MTIVDLKKINGRRFPAGRLTRNVVGGPSSIQAEAFSMGVVTLDPKGGQVPWHNQEQEEIYMILEGEGEMCLGKGKFTLKAGQTIFIPPKEFHQLTNRSEKPLKMLYCYGPAGDVDHWRQELDGTLPKEGVDVPPLPKGAWPQCTDPPKKT